LVGKGIVYDTGGLSIKTKDGMPGMKVDMGGSAGVLGAFMALVKTGCSIPLHAVLCIAENAVGPLATRPDDIHTLLSGKTVEINNTDAEATPSRPYLATLHANALFDPFTLFSISREG